MISQHIMVYNNTRFWCRIWLDILSKGLQNVFQLRQREKDDPSIHMKDV